METLPRDVLLVGVLTRVQNLGGGTAPLKFGKAKTVQNSKRYRATFDLTANIFGSDKDIDKR